jgi:hypothetical protein
MAIFSKNMLIFATLGLWINVTTSLAAASEPRTLNVIIRQGMSFQEIRAKSEAETNAYIDRSFAENPDIESFRLTVLGQKIVEIVPLFSLKITRAQWQSSPHISSWAKYNQASFALLQPRPNAIGGDEEFVAANTTSNAVDQASSNTNSSKRSNLADLDVVEEPVEEEVFVNPQFYLSDID